MLKAKVELEQYLEKICDRIVVDNDKCKAVYNYANEIYNIPKGMISDFIASRVSISEASEFILFILLDSMFTVLKDDRIDSVDKYYTMQEAQFYRKSEYETGKIKFPLSFKMIQIDDDQWIGHIDIKTLMKFREAQLITYNENTQRTMQRIVKGDKEVYKIKVQANAVNQIAYSYANKTFIPNTITLNMPVEYDPEFYYDEETCTLIIKSIDSFDIIDGYHRYVAACRASDMDSEFNYNMELRIVNFTEDKAKQMIYQEDQKTKMRKIDSESMNMTKTANVVVTRLNENVRCNLQGMISRNEGIIPFGELAELVDYFYFKGNTIKGKERTIAIKAINQLTECFNMLTEYNTKYLESKWKYSTLLAAMFCFNYFKDSDISADKLCSIIELTAEQIQNSDDKKFKNKILRKPLMNAIEEIVKEVM